NVHHLGDGRGGKRPDQTNPQQSRKALFLLNNDTQNAPITRRQEERYASPAGFSTAYPKFPLPLRPLNFSGAPMGKDRDRARPDVADKTSSKLKSGRSQKRKGFS